jgi:hypothetical protein
MKIISDHPRPGPVPIDEDPMRQAHTLPSNVDDRNRALAEKQAEIERLSEQCAAQEKFIEKLQMELLRVCEQVQEERASRASGEMKRRLDRDSFLSIQKNDAEKYRQKIEALDKKTSPIGMHPGQQMPMANRTVETERQAATQLKMFGVRKEALMQACRDIAGMCKDCRSLCDEMQLHSRTSSSLAPAVWEAGARGEQGYGNTHTHSSGIAVDGDVHALSRELLIHTIQASARDLSMERDDQKSSEQVVPRPLPECPDSGRLAAPPLPVVSLLQQEIEPAADAARKELQLATIGIEYDSRSAAITAVLFGGPAYLSKKVYIGDVIRGINGRRITSGADVEALLKGAHPPGSTVRLVLRRSFGQEEEVTLRRIAETLRNDFEVQIYELHTAIFMVEEEKRVIEEDFALLKEELARAHSELVHTKEELEHGKTDLSAALERAEVSKQELELCCCSAQENVALKQVVNERLRADLDAGRRKHQLDINYWKKQVAALGDELLQRDALLHSHQASHQDVSSELKNLRAGVFNLPPLAMYF